MIETALNRADPEEVTTMALMRHQRSPRGSELFDPFDRLFDEWMRALPIRWPSADQASGGDHVLRVDEVQEGDTLVIRAELPGVDPEKDVDISVADNMLHIEAERHEEKETKDKGYVRREMRYGTFRRTVPLPQGVAEDDVKATYDAGVLEIRVPMPKAELPERKKIPIAKR